MNKETEDKLSKALHNAIEKALNDNQNITEEEKKLDENLKKARHEIAKKYNLIIKDPKKDIKPLTYDTFDEFYGDDYYNFGKGLIPRPYKKGEFYVRYTNDSLNESIQNYPKPQKIETVISKLRIIGITKDKFEVSDIKDNNGIPGYILIVLKDIDMQIGVLEMLHSNMEILGYFRANPKPIYIKDHPVFGEAEMYQFEPYYFGKHKLTINDQLLYATTIDNKESILKNGFIASCKNKKFQYPPRNYFFTSFIKGAIAGLFYHGRIFTDNKGRNEYIKFFMDVNKLMEAGIEFYSDPMFVGECAVYTYEENIPSSYIKKIEHDLI